MPQSDEPRKRARMSVRLSFDAEDFVSSPDKDRWYFAYGSNLSVDQKELRTGSIRQSIRARLPGYRFEFNKRGEGGQYYANIVYDRHAEVWGVLYLCNQRAFRRLDDYEGVAAGHYERIAVKAELNSGVTVEAIAYVAGADYVCEPGKPNAEYLGKIISGARHHELPDDYIAMVENLAK